MSGTKGVRTKSSTVRSPRERLPAEAELGPSGAVGARAQYAPFAVEHCLEPLDVRVRDIVQAKTLDLRGSPSQTAMQISRNSTEQRGLASQRSTTRLRPRS